MSVRMMAQVWDLRLPPTDKLVLLALADNANDEGRCFPSVGRLIHKTGLAERSIRAIVGRLEEQGFIEREFRSGRSTIYRLTPAADAPLQELHPCSTFTPPLQEMHHTPAADAPITIKEPSSNRQGREVGARAPARPGRKVATRIPEGWQPSEPLVAYAEAELPNVDVGKLAEEFTDYWQARAGEKARKLDWDATWRTWVRRSTDRYPMKQRPANSPQQVQRFDRRGNPIHA